MNSNSGGSAAPNKFAFQMNNNNNSGSNQSGYNFKPNGLAPPQF
jgi:hypothetical protein